jgi:hypothetical protein
MHGNVVFQGPKVKMGIYSGLPTRALPHNTTGRADYFGPLVNRAARYCHAAARGGQVRGGGRQVGVGTQSLDVSNIRVIQSCSWHMRSYNSVIESIERPSCFSDLLPALRVPPAFDRVPTSRVFC